VHHFAAIKNAIEISIGGFENQVRPEGNSSVNLEKTAEVLESSVVSSTNKPGHRKR